jgi:hypothetical protein
MRPTWPSSSKGCPGLRRPLGPSPTLSTIPDTLDRPPRELDAATLPAVHRQGHLDTGRVMYCRVGDRVRRRATSCGQAIGLPLDDLTARDAEAPRSRAAACGRRLRREAPLTSEGRPGHTARRRTRHPTAETRATARRGQLVRRPGRTGQLPATTSHLLTPVLCRRRGPIRTARQSTGVGLAAAARVPGGGHDALVGGVSGPLRAALKTYRKFEQDIGGRLCPVTADA